MLRTASPLLLAASLLASGAAGGEEPASPFRDNARVLFEGCIPSGEASESRTYECPGQSATLTYLGGRDSRISHEALLEVARNNLGLFFSDEVRVTRGTLKFADREQRAYQVTGREREGDGTVLDGYVTVDKTPTGRARFYTCFAEEGSRADLTKCRRILEYFATQGAPEPIDFELASLASGGPPRIRSHQLDMPPGCRPEVRSESTGAIRCPSSLLTWEVRQPSPEPSEWLRTLVKMFRQQVKSAVSEREVDCTVEKQPGRCVQLTSRGATGRSVFYLGVSTVEQHGVMVICTFPGEDDALPAVCRQTLSVEVPTAPAKGTAADAPK